MAQMITSMKSTYLQTPILKFKVSRILFPLFWKRMHDSIQILVFIKKSQQVQLQDPSITASRWSSSANVPTTILSFKPRVGVYLDSIQIWNIKEFYPFFRKTITIGVPLSMM